MAVLDLLEHHGPLLGRADRDLPHGALGGAEHRDGEERSAAGGADSPAVEKPNRAVERDPDQALDDRPSLE
jgi:hypothetical protein